MEQQLQQLEVLAETLYNPTQSDEYKRAVELLQGFSTLKYIPQCKFIMDNSKSQFAILFASSSLLKAISSNWNGFNQELQNAFELRNYLLAYLWNKYTDLQLVTLNSIIKLLCHVTKLSWLTDERHTDIADQIEKFLKSSVQHQLIGQQVLIFLIEEFSSRYTPHSFAVHRKISNSFRDTSLLKAYEYAFETLTNINRGEMPQNNSIADQQLEKILSIIIGCLSYDFLGTTIQSSNEDMSSIQIPASWKPVLEDGAIVTLIYELYSKLQPPRSTQVLECMSLLASIRTSLFQSDKKNLFLLKLMTAMSNILQQKMGLTDSNNHHQFCRVLARLKANYPLNQLYSCDGFQNWLQLVCDFTCTTFMAWQWSPNSVLYLLGLWHRFLTSIAHLKSEEAKSIPEYSSRIAIVYLYSKLDTIQRVNECEEDLLEDEEQLQEQLDAIPSIARCKYPEFGKELTGIIEPLFQQFQSMPQNIDTLASIEGKLSWIVYIIGSVISGRLTVTSMESLDAIDADLAVYAFQILAVHDRRLPMMVQTDHIHHLEMALLSFLNHFRRIFIDKSTTVTKVFVKLQEKLGIETQQTLLELILRKIITNLNYWKNNAAIITKSLTLFHDILGGCNSSKILPKMQIVNMILSHHTVSHFPFLGIEENFRTRTIYYQTLGQLLFMNNFHTNRFEEFMNPFRQSFEILCSQPNTDTLKQPEFKKCLIGLLRDLIGIVSACHTRQLYEMFFEWIYPKYIDIIAKSAAIFYDQADVTSPLLRFAIQMASNKRGRLNFECSSANGVLLFRELSKIVMEYGRRIYDYIPTKDIYRQKLKGIYLTLTVITKLSSGNYIPFGVFELYGDPVLTDSLTVSLKLALGIKKEDLMTHPKLTEAYFHFICSLCQYHTKYLLYLDTADFNKILSSIKDAISTIPVDAEEFHQSCLSLEHLATYYYNNKSKDTEIVRRLKFLFNETAEIFSNILGLLLHLSMFDTANNWEISKTIITLIVINPQQYQLLTEEIIGSQPQDRRPPLAKAFKELMTDVELNLELQNKEVFSKNLVSFRTSSKKILFCD